MAVGRANTAQLSEELQYGENVNPSSAVKHQRSARVRVSIRIASHINFIIIVIFLRKAGKNHSTK
jgi:hypothetical protein